MVKYVAYNIFWERVIATRKTYGHYPKTLHGILEQLMAREIVDLDLTPTQGMIVGYLMHHREPPCARDLEGFFDLSHPTVSGLLSRMEAKGFIEIRPDEKDRRVKRIYPMEKCFACHARISSCVKDNERQMVLGFTQEEREIFEGLLLRAIENLEQKTQGSL